MKNVKSISAQELEKNKSICLNLGMLLIERKGIIEVFSNGVLQWVAILNGNLWLLRFYV